MGITGRTGKQWQQQSEISKPGLHVEGGCCPLEPEPLHLLLLQSHVPGWLGFACAAWRIFPFALTALGSLPRTQGLRFVKCLCLIFIQAIQSMFSGWQASRVASPAQAADHISAGLGDVKKTGI